MFIIANYVKLGPVAHLVGSLIADPGFMSSIPARLHTFVEINRETFSSVILLIPLIQEGLPKTSFRNIIKVSVWIQTWDQTVYKGYQQMIKVTASKERLKQDMRAEL